MVCLGSMGHVSASIWGVTVYVTTKSTTGSVSVH